MAQASALKMKVSNGTCFWIIFSKYITAHSVEFPCINGCVTGIVVFNFIEFLLKVERVCI